DGIRDFHVTGVQTCALPILIVSPLSATLLSAPGASAFSADFEHPVNATAPAMVAAKILFENKLRWNIRFSPNFIMVHFSYLSCCTSAWSDSISVPRLQK